MGLAKTLYEQSEWTKQRIIDGLNYEILQRELTLTETNLLMIAQQENLELKKTEFPNESVSGADWLWILDIDLVEFQVLVQAKRLDTNTLTYPSLDQKIGFDGIYQVDQLIDYAGQIHAIPIYVFYNFVKESPIFESGCFFSSARSIAALVYEGRKSWNDVKKDADPKNWGEIPQWLIDNYKDFQVNIPQ